MRRETEAHKESSRLRRIWVQPIHLRLPQCPLQLHTLCEVMRVRELQVLAVVWRLTASLQLCPNPHLKITG